MRSLSLCLLLLGWLSGCRTYLHVGDQRESLVLRTVERPQGEVTYRLYTSAATTPKINRTRTVREEVATLGVVVRSLGSEVARERGLEPWRGVLVERITRGSAAARGGLRGGDVLLSLGGIPLTSGEQLADLIELELEPFETVSAEVLRSAGDGYELQPRVLELRPDGQMVEEATTDSFDLPTSRLVRRLTGMQMGGVEAELAAEAFQSDHPLVVVGHVQIGSPAYFSGVRGGDRIATCDGQPVRSVLDVHRSVLARARSRGLRASGFDEPDLDGALDAAPAPDVVPQGPVVLELDGPLGPHRAELGLADDLAQVRSFDVPILLDYRADVVRKRVSFLHFIFQWGFHYQRAWQPSETRRAERSTHLSILPLGMFEFESRPTKKEHTFFWFITFESRR